ncbi:MAG: hypothetical protein CSA05_01360 [Bacteroidia bacterium]|nr:MAG: hypothetical protein CSA05_01360 [Bacteroidia bacterium]
MREKKELLKEIMTALAKADNEKADKLTQVFLDYIPEITSEEVSKVAQELDDEGVFADASQHINIERKVFEIIETKIPKQDLKSFPKGHPIHTFLEENKQIIALKKRAEELLQAADSFTNLKSDWALLAKQFLAIDIHYLRKENQLFPYLEKRGFSHPSTIMWSLHDEIRRQAKLFSQAVNDNNEELAREWLSSVAREAYEMTVKEEKILLTKSMKLLSETDWREIREGEDEIGWMIPKPPVYWQKPAKMEAHLSVSQNRIDAIMEIIKDFFAGKDVSQLKEYFNEKLEGKITASEFALAEQKLANHGISDTEMKDKVEDLINIFKSSLEKVSIKDLDEGHPIDTFIRENKAIKSLVDELRKKDAETDINNVDAEWWDDAYAKIRQIHIHYLRKENQLFPYLEQKGFDKPSTVMWALHDDVRSLIKYYDNLRVEKNYEALFATQEMLFTAIEDMMFKEEKILWATSLDLLTQEEWVEIRLGENEIGYCLIAEPPMWNPNWTHPSEAKTGVEKHTSDTVSAVPFNAGSALKSSAIGGINLEVGSITPEQINLLFKHLPFDVTYVDEFDEVRYYNKGEDRVFPRSPGIIGRQVKYCHPPKSVHIVEKIVDAFKKGERNEASFWINFRDKFVYIQYFAVRDDAGNYKGVLEITYDGTTIRKLEGEQRLLDWE